VHIAIANATRPSGEPISPWLAATAVLATNQYTTKKGNSLATLSKMKEGLARGPRVGRGHRERAVAAAATKTLMR
jgi:hypothetical protein